MKKGKKFVTVMLLFCLIFNASISVGATETNKKQKLTEEEKKAKEELDKAYAIPIESNGWEGWPQAESTYGEAAIVMEVETGTILYAKNIDAKMYPASITKVLTALVAMEEGNLSDTVTFSRDCVSFLQPGDSSVGLKEGNVITLEQTMYAMLLASANEAAYAVGENVGKNAGYDYAWFIDKMNQKVQDLGGVNSHFTNTNGLHDPEHYTCARDMALIGRALFAYPEIFEIMQTVQYQIPETDTVEEHVFQQKDKMLLPYNSNYYKNTIGGKTGYTSDAKSTLITMADDGNMKLVAVVLRTYGRNIYPDTTRMLKYAFDNFEVLDVHKHETGEEIKELSAKEEKVVVPKGTAFEDLEREITIGSTDEELMGEYSAGEISYLYYGQKVGSADVLLTDDYLKSQGIEIREQKKQAKAKVEMKDNQEEESFAKKILHSLKDKFLEMSLKDQVILVGSSVLLLLLIFAFFGAWIHVRSVRRKKRKRARAHRKK